MLKGKWIWERFKWPVLLLATLKGWGWPFTAPLTCLLQFTKKLAGKKTNLCLRLCLNYTWHINSTERRQSRKLAAKEDRGGDQEWHRMSSNSSFYPLYIPALLTTGCCPTSPCSIFFPWLATAQPALAVRRCPSFPSGLLSLLQTAVFEYFVPLPLHSQMDALSALAIQICLPVWVFCTQMRCFFLFQNAMSDFEYMHPGEPIKILHSSTFDDFVKNHRNRHFYKQRH